MIECDHGRKGGGGGGLSPDHPSPLGASHRLLDTHTRPVIFFRLATDQTTHSTLGTESKGGESVRLRPLSLSPAAAIVWPLPVAANRLLL